MTEEKIMLRNITAKFQEIKIKNYTKENKDDWIAQKFKKIISQRPPFFFKLQKDYENPTTTYIIQI